MNWEDTVLSPEQLRAINDDMPMEAKYGNVFLEIAEQQAKETWDKAVREVVAKLEEWEREMPAGIDFIAANRGHLWPYIELLKKEFGL